MFYKKTFDCSAETFANRQVIFAPDFVGVFSLKISTILLKDPASFHNVLLNVTLCMFLSVSNMDGVPEVLGSQSPVPKR